MKTSHQGYVRRLRVPKQRRVAALLLLLACAALYPSTLATTSTLAGAAGSRVVSTGRTPNFAGVAVAAAPNEIPIYGQPYDGRAVEVSSKIQGGIQYDREAADDFDLNATITRVLVRGGRGGYNMPPNPIYYGVYVRFYDGTQGMPGALQVEHYLPAGTPGVVFNASQPGNFDITLPTPFNAAGKHFLSVQPVFGGSETWAVSSGNYPNVRGAAWVKRDRAANAPWAGASIAGRPNDMSFDLFGTLLTGPRLDTLSPNPVSRSGLVRVSGANFGAARGASQLTIDGKQSQYIAHWSDNLIVAYVPEASTIGDVPVSITTAAGTGSATLGVTTRPADGRIRWRFTVAGDYVPRRAEVGPDGTVYINDVLGRLYALTPDGGLKWVFQAGLIGAMGPVSVGGDGTIYIAGLVPRDPGTTCEASQFLVNVEGIFAVRPDGTRKWLFDKTCDDLLSGPNVGPDGNIHVVTDATGIGAFALKPDGTLAHAPTGRFGVDGAQGTEIVFGPAAPGQAPTQKYFQYESGGLFGYTLEGQRVFLYAINAVGITQPVAGQQTGTIYTTTDNQTAGRFFAVSPQGALRWVSPIRPVSRLSIPDAPPSESAVYIVQDQYRLHRVNPADGSVVWTFIDGETLYDPVASPDDRLVLLGGRINVGQPGFFEAVSNDGRKLWKQYLPNEPGFGDGGQVMPNTRARFTADGQTAYIAADVLGDNRTESNPVYSFFYALDTSDDNVPVNRPPTATVTSPLPNSSVPVRTEINFTARAEDDAQIARVDFYYNHNGFQTLLGSDTTPDAGGIYGVKFTPPDQGTYGLFAAAYDAGGLRGDSPLVTITASSQPPTVSWVSPAGGSTFAAPAGLTLVARAADSDGTVAGVEFRSYQAGVSGSNVIGSDATPDAGGNYQIEWANPPQGTHELTATAIDNSGLSRSAVVTVTVGPAATPVYTIGGTVRDPAGSPMSGVSVTLGNSSSATATTGADGSYLFSDLQGGGSYSVTPFKAAYSFSPPQLVFNNLGANQTANFTGARNSYAVSGQIKDNHNVALVGVTVTLSGGQAAATTTDANGNYSFPSVAAGGDYVVTPSRVNYTFAPANATLTNLSADQAANFSGTLNTHGISGRVTENGNSLAGVTVTLTGAQSGTATTDAGGNYSFTNLAAGGNYIVTPGLSNYTFAPASRAFNSLSANQTGDFAGTLDTHVISGRIVAGNNNGLAGVAVALTGAQSGSTRTDADGSYSFVGLPAGGNYTVTPSPASYMFAPASRTFNQLGGNQSADFAATPLTFTLSGRVAQGETGLAGLTVTISGDRTGTTTTDAQGNYSFGNLPSGGSIVVTPSGANYTFAPPSQSINIDGVRAGVNFAAVPVPNVIQFSAQSYQFSEADGRATITVTRAGDTSGAASVVFQTTDDPEAVPCVTVNSKAYARCDYATTVETLSWAAGDARPKTVVIPLIDDSRAEGNETLQIKLSGPQGGLVGGVGTAALTIQDTEAAEGTNPLGDNGFFVRMQYLDFLSREPEAGEPWTNVLNNCPDANNDPACDRRLVSSAFFQSPEFQLKGLYTFLFYKAAFGRLPEYGEIIPDMRSVAGQTGAEVFQKRAAYATAFAQRPEFTQLYGPMTDLQYVDALLGRYGLQQITTEVPADPEGAGQVTLTREQLASALTDNSLTRAQVLRAVVQSGEADAAEYHGAFVAMQYYGYLRRTPEQSGYDAWLRVIRQDPSNVRMMVDGFVNSQEYRLRFGQP